MGWIQKISSSLTNGKSASDQQRYSDDDDVYYSLHRPSKTTSGEVVTPDLALKASAVYACVKVLAETIAALPLQMKRILPDGGFEPALNHPINELISFQPNTIQTAVEFWETTVFHAALRGGGYAEIIPGPRGAVDQLKSLHADRVVTEVLSDGSLRFRVTNPHTGLTRVLLQEEVFRIPGMSSDGIRGIRAVDLAADAIGLGMAADTYAARVFSNNLSMGGFLTTQGKLSDPAARRLVTKLMEKFSGGENFHRPMILQGGMKYEKASMTASEAQLLEARKWQIGEIARFWRIPLHMLGLDDQTNKSTVEEQSINFVKYTLLPWVRRIELAIRRDLILVPNAYAAKYDLNSLQLGNMAAIADYSAKALGAGGTPPWMTQNEVRVMQGMNRRPEPWADELPRGTNPAGTDPATGSNTLPAKKNNTAIEDLSNGARAARLAKRENTAVRKSYLRLVANPDGFRDWTKAFYGGHVSTVMETLDIPREPAKAYCGFQRDELLKANDVAGLIDQRDERLAADITAILDKARSE